MEILLHQIGVCLPYVVSNLQENEQLWLMLPTTIIMILLNQITMIVMLSEILIDISQKIVKYFMIYALW